MKKEYYYCDLYSDSLIELLKKNNVKYEILDYGTLVPKMVRFTVMEGHSIITLLPDYSTTKPLITCIYSKKELLDAEFLTLRPKKWIIDITNIDDVCEYSCERISYGGNLHYGHCTQKGSFTIAPFKGSDKTFFFSESTGCSVLFARKSVATVIRKNNITGILFFPVYQNTKNKEMVEADFWQLLSDEMIYLNNICLDEPERIKKCPICGKTKIFNGQGYQLKLLSEKLALNQDFYMTEAVFGDGIPCPLFIVSQKLYRLLKEQHFDKNVTFEPVILI